MPHSRTFVERKTSGRNTINIDEAKSSPNQCAAVIRDNDILIQLQSVGAKLDTLVKNLTPKNKSFCNKGIQTE